MKKYWPIKLIFVLLFVCNFKQIVWANPYADVDKHALSISAKQSSVLQLTHLLVRPFNAQDEKIRAIYRWITANIRYDMNAYNERRMGNFSPQEILSSGECICGGYANLFKTMVNIAGFEAELITGYSKGYAYDAKLLFEEDNQHAWNAVKVNDQWQLIDATWGAGYINDEMQFVAAFNDFYFFTPPEQLIKTHYPHQTQWQLLKHKKSRTDFANSVYTRPAFFHYGLSVMSHPFYHIKCDNSLQIKLSADPDILLLARLVFNDQKLAENLTFVQKRGNIVEVNVLFPYKQEYTVRLFARHKNSTGHFEWVMDYAVDAENGHQNAVGFPEQFAAFVNRNVYLYSPIQQFLQPGHLQKFLIKIDRAQQAAIIIDGRFHFLKSVGKQLFSGAVTVPSGELFLTAQFPGNDHFDYLLKFEGWK